MINIRFHVVSIVAVFLALGIGVAMGASFIDRATVSSMQDRVDDLETGFRDRGGRLERYEDVLRGNDEAAEALTEPASRAIDQSLAEVPVVIVSPTGRPEGSLAVLSEVLSNASADVVGTIELQESIADDSDAGAELAEALAALSATADTPAETVPDPVPGEPSASTQSAEAIATLDSFSEAGLIAVDAAGQPAEVAFPATTGVRYVVVLADNTTPGATDWIVPFVESYGQRSAATLLVAGVAASRSAGDLPAEPDPDAEDPAIPLPELLEPIRTGAASNEVSSVQFATEPLARLSVVFGVQALTEDIVGHYGLGEGVETPYPAAAQE
ncbi:MAG: copper transporter [Microthrixaceae bacterium]